MLNRTTVSPSRSSFCIRSARAAARTAPPSMHALMPSPTLQVVGFLPHGPVGHGDSATAGFSQGPQNQEISPRPRNSQPPRLGSRIFPPLCPGRPRHATLARSVHSRRPERRTDAYAVQTRSRAAPAHSVLSRFRSVRFPHPWDTRRHPAAASPGLREFREPSSSFPRSDTALAAWTDRMPRSSPRRLPPGPRSR